MIEALRERVHGLSEEATLTRELFADTSPHIDERFMAIAKHVVNSNPSSIFSRVPEEYLDRQPRPDAVNHRYTYLPPNVSSSAELDRILGYVDMLLGPEEPAYLEDKFAAFCKEHDVFERIEEGQTFIFPSNHIELQDQGFTLGLMHRAARREAGFDRFEHFATIMVGRLVGYFELKLAKPENVIDDILRKAAGVLKTFPAGGGEALDEDSEDEELMRNLGVVRKISNHRTKEAFEDLTHSSTGGVVLLAGGGAQDRRDEEGNLHIHTFGKGTKEMISTACKHGALVVPLFVDYGGDKSLVEFDEPRPITDLDAVDGIGEHIAAMGNRQRGYASETHPEIARFAGKIMYDAA